MGAPERTMSACASAASVGSLRLWAFKGQVHTPKNAEGVMMDQLPRDVHHFEYGTLKRAGSRIQP
jgi:hypothetical protein